MECYGLLSEMCPNKNGPLMKTKNDLITVCGKSGTFGEKALNQEK